MVRYCPICGKSDAEASFAGELCSNCAKSRLPPLPALKIVKCKKCGFILDKGRKRKGASLGEEAIRLLRLKGKNASFDEKMMEVEHDFGGGRIKRLVKISSLDSICTDCSRAASQYFEAIIQLRGVVGKVNKAADFILARLERRSFVPKVEELKEGIDIYCGSRSEAIAALNSLGLGFYRTEKLAGQRDGRRLYRTTLLVRL